MPSIVANQRRQEAEDIAQVPQVRVTRPRSWQALLIAP
jgi:hypothetical protein